MTIGIYSRVYKEDHTPYVLELLQQLHKHDIDVLMYDEYYKAIKKNLPKQKINTFKIQAKYSTQ